MLNKAVTNDRLLVEGWILTTTQTRCCSVGLYELKKAQCGVVVCVGVVGGVGGGASPMLQLENEDIPVRQQLGGI